MSSSSSSVQANLRFMMKEERVKRREKRKIDEDRTIRAPGGASNLARGILKPTSHHLYESINHKESTSKSLESSTINTQDSINSSIHQAFENTSIEKRRVAFQNDVMVNYIPIVSDEASYVEDTSDTSIIDSGQLDEFFQSIDDIKSSGNEKVNFDTETSTIENNEVSKGTSVSLANESYETTKKGKNGTAAKEIKIKSVDLEGEMEQAAYEARLARLLFLRSQQHHTPTTSIINIDRIIDPNDWEDSSQSILSSESNTQSLKQLIRKKLNKRSLQSSVDDSYWNNID